MPSQEGGTSIHSYHDDHHDVDGYSRLRIGNHISYEGGRALPPDKRAALKSNHH
jgi:hypothetical protein